MKYMTIYSLTDEEYQSFLNGIPFDNSKFMISNYLQTKETRKYQGFSKSIHSADSLKALREEYKKMMENQQIIISNLMMEHILII